MLKITIGHIISIFLIQKNIHCRLRWAQYIVPLLAFACAGTQKNTITQQKSKTESKVLEFRQFDTIPSEVSGVTQLPNGKLFMIRDEAGESFYIGEIDPTSMKIHVKAPNLPKDYSLFHDLEAIAHGRDILGFATGEKSCNAFMLSEYYITTSHSKGDPTDLRNQIAQIDYSFTEGLYILGHIRSLKQNAEQGLYAAYPPLKQGSDIWAKNDGALDIEGLAYHPSEEKLYIGFRSVFEIDQTTQKKKTLILTLNNPQDFFVYDNIIPEFTPIFVDLNGHGIRSMEYDNILRGMIIVAGPVPSTFDFELFLYDGKETKPLIINGFHETVLQKQLRPEGVTQVCVNKKKKLLFVTDDGDNAISKYLFVDYSDIVSLDLSKTSLECEDFFVKNKNFIMRNNH